MRRQSKSYSTRTSQRCALLFSTLFVLSWLLSACGSKKASPDASGLDASADASRRDADVAPRACSSDEECDDGVACTGDRCDRLTLVCTNERLDLNCDPGLVCDSIQGCIPPTTPDAGTCLATGGTCSSDMDCCRGLFCDTHSRCACHPAGSTILDGMSGACNRCCSRRCMGGACAVATEGQFCMVDTDCDTSFCDAGVCATPDCPPGFVDCNGSEADGCEATLDSPENCGSCGNACPAVPFPHMVATCSSGTCSRACQGSWFDCNDNLADGCEVNLAETGGRCGCTMVGACSRESDCCTGVCNEGSCCGRTGDYCASDFDCCFGGHICRGERCCRTFDTACSSDSDCCSNLCNAGRCDF